MIVWITKCELVYITKWGMIVSISKWGMIVWNTKFDFMIDKSLLQATEFRNISIEA